jgi:hypothetical protein
MADIAQDINTQLFLFIDAGLIDNQRFHPRFGDPWVPYWMAIPGF